MTLASVAVDAYFLIFAITLHDKQVKREIISQNITVADVAFALDELVLPVW